MIYWYRGIYWFVSIYLLIYIIRNICFYMQMFFENVNIVQQWFVLKMKFVGIDKSSWQLYRNYLVFVAYIVLIWDKKNCHWWGGCNGGEEECLFRKIWRVILSCLPIICRMLLFTDLLFKNLLYQLQKRQKFKFFGIFKHRNELKNYCMYKGCLKWLKITGQTGWTSKSTR